MFGRAKEVFETTLREIREAGLYKEERVITTPQSAEIGVGAGEAKRSVLNFCANNYLGLSSHPAVIKAAHEAIETHGFERKISSFFGTEDTILYSSCFDANGGLFETLLGEEDAIISDALNHASIIDGVRLCKAERKRYANGDMAALEEALKETQGKRLRMIATDGVFSMDGYLAKLDLICDLAEKYNAMVMVDDSHASGFIGKTGRGTPEHFGVQSRVDVMTSTLGKALGGAAGGFTTAKKEIVDLLRQRSRPYLFSNSIPPAIAGASVAILDLLASTTELRDRLMSNAKRFRDGVVKAGFDVKEGVTPIVPVMLGDARLASELAKGLLDEGIYVIGFSFPVVPKGQARIRVQLSAQHTDEQIDRAVGAFATVGKRLGILKS
jgi:glycine C-acetyltransferase